MRSILCAAFVFAACGPVSVEPGVCALPNLSTGAPSESGAVDVEGTWELNLTTSTINSSVTMYTQTPSGWSYVGAVAGAGSANPWDAGESDIPAYFAAVLGEASTPARVYFAKIGTTTIRATMVGCLPVDGGAPPN